MRIPLERNTHAQFRRNPKEVVNMYSEALKIMEHNTELYMIAEFRKAKEEAEALVA